MTGILLLVSASACALDTGWQPVAGGGIEYIVRLDRAALDRLRAGEDLSSDFPTSGQGVRRLRITTQRGVLPHQGEPLPEVAQVNQDLPGPLDPAADETPAASDAWDEAIQKAPRRLRRGAPTPRGSSRFQNQVPGRVLIPKELVGEATVPEEDSTPDDDSARSVRGQVTPLGGETRYRPFASGRRVVSTAYLADGPELAEASGMPAASKYQAKRPLGSRTNASKAYVPPDEEGPSPSDEDPLPANATQRPWLPLSAALIALCVSLGANLYLAWLLVGARQHVRDLALEQRLTPAMSRVSQPGDRALRMGRRAARAGNLSTGVDD